jgi:hypothetical protein
MKFIQRLKFYGIGFGMGCLIVYAMVGTRSCVTTNEMKMQELVFQPFEISEKAQCKLKCLVYNEALLKIEMRNFEVNYDLTNVHADPCGTYFIQPKKEFASKYKFDFVINDCDSISKILDINIQDSNVKCDCK